MSFDQYQMASLDDVGSGGTLLDQVHLRPGHGTGGDEGTVLGTDK